MSRKKSTTAVAIAKLEELGYIAEVVEKRIPRCNISKDLFGCIDILALGKRETRAVQVTDHTSVSKRVRKVQESDALPRMREAGWRIEVWGVKNGEVCRIVDLS